MTKPRAGDNQKADNQISHIIIDGIPVELSFKKVVHGRLVVNKRGCVRLVIPYKIKNYRVEEFLHSKINWLKYHLRKISINMPVERKFEPGETVTLFGSKYPCKISVGKVNSVKMGDEAVEMVFKPNTTHQKKIEALRLFYKKTLVPVIEQRIEYWEQQTGLKCAQMKVRQMRSCWGSCYPERQFLQFNLALVKKPLYCIDYIVVHELAHLVSRLHDDKFKAFLTKYVPSWRIIRKKIEELKGDYLD